ncbi:unnamed protein product [Acanthoscelides obtectus]|uniref:Uncharacterized protein n=1 Tax=Acanthoscelides obtectus TaxID=200917 RepID=A0A9P0JNY4_ACAOB|nr:unnamed protein product [Acanthoscelides obtectus]CAK1642967.1 hypothetical protein AOBTE_LOCUS13324 [Acanthoscelides obtectus]
MEADNSDNADQKHNGPKADQEKNEDKSSMKISSSDWNILKLSSPKGKEKGTNQEATDDDDIPGDFFDDFLKDDFMAGLDVVDEDEEVDETTAAEEIDKDTEAQKSVKSRPGVKARIAKRPTNERVQNLANKDKASVSKNNQGKESKSQVRTSDHKSSVSSCKKVETEDKKSKKAGSDDKKSRKTETEDKKKDESYVSDSRRDPKKTKRDIERDKERCEKDKEKKLITEKLSLVETGLVPPGMEMEIDVDEIKRQRNEIEQMKEELDKLQRPKSRSPRRRSPRRRSSSRGRNSPKRKRSTERRSPRRSPKRSPRRKRSPAQEMNSPMRRALINEIARAEQISLSPIREKRDDRRSSPRRGSSRDRRSPLRKTSPRGRGSPFYRRSSRSSSPPYRGGRRYSPVRRRSPSRERDRRRRRSRTRSPKRPRKEKSFLQEIVEKLNETGRPQMPMQVQGPPHGGPMYPPMGPQALIAPQPMPHLQVLPAPQQVPHPMQPAPMMQAFMPSGPVIAPGPVPSPVPPPASVGPTFLPQPMQKYDQNFFIGDASLQMPIMPQISPNSGSKQSLSGSGKNHKNAGAAKVALDSKDEVSKLFQDKKISLSQFLAISAKPEASSSNPDELREKIKVITRCQEAIKFLNKAEKKFSGRLYVHKTQPPSLAKTISPLKRIAQVKIPFTELPSKAENVSAFSGRIERLIQHLGLQSEVIEIEDKEDKKTSLPAPPPPSISASTVQSRPGVVGCPDCAQRKKILYRSTGTQYSDDHMSYSISTQVSEDDLRTNRIPKNQSLASLTPAQLLAKSQFGGSSKMDKDEFDIFPQKHDGYLRGPGSGGRSREGYGGGVGRNNFESDYRYRF